MKWQKIRDTLRTKYLGSLFEAGGEDMSDVKSRVVMVKQRFGKFRYIHMHMV